MTAINVTNVNVLDNPSKVTNPLQFEIQYECLYDLPDDLEWRLVYVGSAENQKYDQLLDEVFVGPVSPGQYRFVFQANPPDFSKIPSDDIVGVTIILLTCSYRDQEFIRVGYYVNNEYAEEALKEEPPSEPEIEKLWRNILADKPRVTKFSIEWEAVKKDGSATDLQQGEEQGVDQQQREGEPVHGQQHGGDELIEDEVIMTDEEDDEEEEEEEDDDDDDDDEAMEL